MWQRFLAFLRRNDFDYAPPFAPEVNHPFEKDEKLNCCTHCGGGSKHAIHSKPYDVRRVREIEAESEGMSPGERREYLAAMARRTRKVGA